MSIKTLKILSLKISVLGAYDRWRLTSIIPANERKVIRSLVKEIRQITSNSVDPFYLLSDLSEANESKQLLDSENKESHSQKHGLPDNWRLFRDLLAQGMNEQSDESYSNGQGLLKALNRLEQEGTSCVKSN